MNGQSKDLMKQSIAIVAQNEQNFTMPWTYDLVRRMVEVEKLASVQEVFPILEQIIEPQVDQLTISQIC